MLKFPIDDVRDETRCYQGPAEVLHLNGLRYPPRACTPCENAYHHAEVGRQPRRSTRGRVQCP